MPLHTGIYRLGFRPHAEVSGAIEIALTSNWDKHRLFDYLCAEAGTIKRYSTCRSEASAQRYVPFSRVDRDAGDDSSDLGAAAGGNMHS